MDWHSQLWLHSAGSPVLEKEDLVSLSNTLLLDWPYVACVSHSSCYLLFHHYIVDLGLDPFSKFVQNSGRFCSSRSRYSINLEDTTGKHNSGCQHRYFGDFLLACRWPLVCSLFRTMALLTDHSMHAIVHQRYLPISSSFGNYECPSLDREFGRSRSHSCTFHQPICRRRKDTNSGRKSWLVCTVRHWSLSSNHFEVVA